MSDKVILCVDDESIVLNSLEMQLKDQFGDTYIYEFAESAEEALEIMEEFTEEGLELLVIVSDWLMPGLKGDEFLIKVHKKFPKIVKVLLTGQADEDAIKRAQDEANLHRCIHKPWDADELIDTIRTGLEKI
ncbi:MAG: response regulator [Candidatus Marithrix sp.]